MWKVNFLAIWIWLAVTVAVLTGCEGAWNNPYPPQATNANVMYSSFSERPKHFDPARSYSSNEYEFIGQIYEPLQISAASSPLCQAINEYDVDHLDV